jgi:hypothetical protein
VGNAPTGNVLPAGEELVNSGLERPSIGSLYRTRAGFGKKADSRSCDDLEGGIGLRDGHVHPLILDSHDHVPVLVVAEYLGSGALQAIEGLGGGMRVGIVRTDLDDGDLWGKWLRKRGVEEVLEPWCATLRTV